MHILRKCHHIFPVICLGTSVANTVQHLVSPLLTALSLLRSVRAMVVASRLRTRYKHRIHIQRWALMHSTVNVKLDRPMNSISNYFYPIEKKERMFYRGFSFVKYAFEVKISIRVLFVCLHFTFNSLKTQLVGPSVQANCILSHWASLQEKKNSWPICSLAF